MIVEDDDADAWDEWKEGKLVLQPLATSWPHRSTPGVALLILSSHYLPTSIKKMVVESSELRTAKVCQLSFNNNNRLR